MAPYSQRFGRAFRTVPATPFKILDFAEGFEMPEDKELNDVEFLRDLAERLRRIPVMYGTDDGDISRLHQIAEMLDNDPAKEI